MTSRRPADEAGLDDLPDLADLLRAHGLNGVAEESFEHDGWSGAQLTRLTRPGDGARFVLKRDGREINWIARATADPELREARLVAAMPRLPAPVTLPHLGVARDGPRTTMLMTDLAGHLLPWERPVDEARLEAVLAALAELHRRPWPATLSATFPWCPIGPRLVLTARPSALRYEAAGNPVGSRFLAGWAAFERHARPPVGALVDGLAADPTPLVRALGRRPAVGLHGDLKLGNVAILPSGRVPMIDWQMTLVAPVAVDLGWFLVVNVHALPLPPDEVLERYRRHAGVAADEGWRTEVDLAILVGLVLRGWRKGLDVESSMPRADGVGADADLRWWSETALAARDRRL